MRFRTILLLCLLVVPLGAQAQDRASETVTVTALAVAETSQGFQGVHASVQATVLGGGTGQVFVSTKPLADTDMQGSARLAARVAAGLVGVPGAEYDYLVEFRSGSSVIGGPSAGGVMALALTVALHNVAHPDDPWTLDPAVAGTGTINPDGTIGPVGGIPAKAEAAADAGIDLFLYPAGLDTAFDVERGPFGLQQVEVEMQAHCDGLGITCRAAASLDEILEAAVHVEIERPRLPVPSTVTYEAELAPTVREQVDRLAARLDAPVPEGLSAAALERIDGERAGAAQRLEAARGSLGEGQYYLAATQGFQGHILMGRAEALQRLHASDGDERVVIEALEACGSAVDAAAARVDGHGVDGLNTLHALAAAEGRMQGARDLRDAARELHEDALRFEGWVQSMFTAAFCKERAATAVWWLEVGNAFGAGPPVGDLASLLEDATGQAQELVAYAQAVTGSSGEAGQFLEQAARLESDGYLAGALASAVEAQTFAAVQVQTASGPDVPEAVLDAARDAAAQAIQAARAHGAEPLLPVSLVELAGSNEDSAVALANLWSARTLALVGDASTPPPAVSGTATPGGAGAAAGYPDSTLLAAMVIGTVLGAAMVAIAWSLRRG